MAEARRNAVEVRILIVDGGILDWRSPETFRSCVIIPMLGQDDGR